MAAYNRESITVSSTAIGFTESKVNLGQGFQPKEAVFIVEDAPIRVTVDGTTPTASIGHPYNTGDIVTIEGESEINKFRAIRSTVTDATIQPTYFNGLG